MDTEGELMVIAFAGSTQVAAGPLLEVALATKALIDQGTEENVLVFNMATSDMVEVDFRGTEKQFRARIERQTAPKQDADTASPRGPGRPKLGVVAREVTLMPRHWEWLAQQPGGASVALRKLVEDARRSNVQKDQVRQAREVAYRFMSAMAGDLVGFEEATRALFGDDGRKFNSLVRAWPADVAQHLKLLTAGVFSEEAVL
jgi:uncharacterized protein